MAELEVFFSFFLGPCFSVTSALSSVKDTNIEGQGLFFLRQTSQCTLLYNHLYFTFSNADEYLVLFQKWVDTLR